MIEKEKNLSNQKTPKKIDVFLQFLAVSTNLKKTVKIISILIILFFLNVGVVNPAASETITVKMSSENYSAAMYPLIVRNRLQEKLVTEVGVYIETMAPTSKVSPETLVEMCQKYNLNIIFVLAQGLLESHFGTRGKSVTTKSVFNVGTYDDGKVAYRYKNVNESIEPYMKLLREEYLVNKEISQLIKDRGYKDVNGYRFATSVNYEQQLRKLMIDIDMQTPIKMYQDIINLNNDQIISYFGPMNNDEQINLQANNDTIKRTVQ